MKNTEQSFFLSTGELSRQLNISVRTIRYYDQIGLVQPSRKAPGGRRAYSREDILNLQKVLLLKSLNLSLEDSRSILGEHSLSSILTAHRAILNEEIQQLESALNQTQSLMNHLYLTDGSVQWEDLITLVAEKKARRDWGKYFSPAQQSVLDSRLPKLESGEVTTKKWINLIKRIEHCLEHGLPPDSKEGQLILEDVKILSDETFGHDPDLAETFWQVRSSPTTSAELGLYPIDPKIIRFLEEADTTKEA